MREFLLGHHHKTKKPINTPVSSFDTHWHLIGGTGKGKTVSIVTMLLSLFVNPLDKHCFIIIDRMGGFSFTLLRWFAAHAPKFVRDRFLYIEGANEQHIVGFNPLEYTTPAHGYYKVSRALELVLRAWESVDIQAMPRLARWGFNTFYAAAQLGLNLADCVHFLLPHSDLHRKLLGCLPPQLRSEWQEILKLPSKATEILDSTRNRLKPYWEMDILRQMFSVTKNRMDILKWMQEGKIVLINLAPQGRIPEQIADAMGGLVLNEVLSVARSLPMGAEFPTYLVLDEFQRFVGPDIDAAIPEVRQLGVKLLLSHQSFSQLTRGDYDLSSIIWQCQSRMMFGVQGEDADLLAHEVASLNFDPYRIKNEIWHRKQLVTGHSIVELASRSTTESLSRQWSENFGMSWGTNENRAKGIVVGESENRADQKGGGRGEGRVTGSSHSVTQAMLPEYERFMELASKSFTTFEEQRSEWARDIRKLKTGQALLRLVNDDSLYHIDVKRTAPGSLSLNWATVCKSMPKVADQVQQLRENNFTQDCFVSPTVVERETRERLEKVLCPKIVVQSSPKSSDVRALEVSSPLD